RQGRGLLRGRGRREHPIADVDHRADPDDRCGRDGGDHRDLDVPADVQAADAHQVAAAAGGGRRAGGPRRARVCATTYCRYLVPEPGTRYLVPSRLRQKRTTVAYRAPPTPT